MSSDHFEVTSEIHVGSEVDVSAKPKVSIKNVVTNFTFKLPSNLPQNKCSSRYIVDEDGDFIVNRRNTTNSEDGVIAIEQSNSTSLELVGLQVWRGALLLADFILDQGSLLLKDNVVLELGSGTGLTSIVAAIFAKEVICTDIDIGDILELIKANFSRNDKYIKAKFSVLGLDFYARQWSNSLETKLTDVSVVLVADVIYDNDLTEAFVTTLEKLMAIPPEKTFYIALEKRYVFTVADLESVAPCYDHFLQYLSNMKSIAVGLWAVQELPLDFPQYFNYDRVKELVLLKIQKQ